MPSCINFFSICLLGLNLINPHTATAAIKNEMLNRRWLNDNQTCEAPRVTGPFYTGTSCLRTFQDADDDKTIFKQGGLFSTKTGTFFFYKSLFYKNTRLKNDQKLRTC